MRFSDFIELFYRIHVSKFPLIKAFKKLQIYSTIVSNQGSTKND